MIKIIVNIGNIPSKQELIFITEFIQATKSIDNGYIFDFFPSSPILKNKLKFVYKNENIKGKVEILTKSKIQKIDKYFSDNNLIIKEEIQDNNENKFFMKFEYNKNEKNLVGDYKIYFELETPNYITLFSQTSAKYKDEKSYLFNYKLSGQKNSITAKDNKELEPALFIFLIDQSGSMNDLSMEIVKEALPIFLPFLQKGSFYQMIGFGYKFKIYDQFPKEYNEENIKKSLEVIDSLDNDMGELTCSNR